MSWTYGGNLPITLRMVWYCVMSTHFFNVGTAEEYRTFSAGLTRAE